MVGSLEACVGEGLSKRNSQGKCRALVGEGVLVSSVLCLAFLPSKRPFRFLSILYCTVRSICHVMLYLRTCDGMSTYPTTPLPFRALASRLLLCPPSPRTPIRQASNGLFRYGAHPGTSCSRNPAGSTSFRRPVTCRACLSSLPALPALRSCLPACLLACLP